jgi:hypothetical protein
MAAEHIGTKSSGLVAELVATLVSRRSFEFPPDSIRLSILCTETGLLAISSAFQFQIRAVATPPAIFGPPESTSPPGAVFQNGQLAAPGQPLVGVRAINIDARRVVVEVSGNSDDTERVFTHLQEALGSLNTEDGKPVLGEVERRRDMTELVVRMGVTLDALIAPSLMREVGARTSKGEVAIPVVALHVHPASGEYRGVQAGDPVYVLQKRAGTPVDSALWYSSAPLATSAHVEFLRTIETAVSGKKS